MFKGLLWATDEVCILHEKNLEEFEQYVNSTTNDTEIRKEVMGYHKQIPRLVRASKDLYIGVLIGNDLLKSSSTDLKLLISLKYPVN